MMAEVLQRMEKEDPVEGLRVVPNTGSSTIWCDASSIALEVILEIKENVVEDASWLRKKDDHGHINVAELDAVVKDMSMAQKWNITSLNVITDSATVFRWLNTIILNKC